LINDVDIWISVVKDVCLEDDMVSIKEVVSVDVEDESIVPAFLGVDDDANVERVFM